MTLPKPDSSPRAPRGARAGGALNTAPSGPRQLRAAHLHLGSEVAAAQATEPAVHQVIAAQEREHGLATHAEAAHLLQDRLVLRIDHQPAPQVADALGLEAEREVQPREVVVERGVEE